ncbi:hypothetical protein [Halanaerobacter jeridensis]|uniref:Rubrerythrin n=1 Tax=Halanaerobacter jeridensis TaxID=706427 RepID=A0A938XSL8_9FIRM|nr:hypothetical protein [Halanaerobacter jeridensis]MBM7556743.1 rubrerythrin [Halanaerobacter jeridensis]
MAKLPSNIRQKIKESQKDEITEYHIYSKLAEIVSDEKNSQILYEIGQDELEHYNFWTNKMDQQVKPILFQWRHLNIYLKSQREKWKLL